MIPYNYFKKVSSFQKKKSKVKLENFHLLDIKQINSINMFVLWSKIENQPSLT